jgi:lysophospholipase L1-like esterase/pimeloyl-ACP methyl ester carboxylesterase
MSMHARLNRFLLIFLSLGFLALAHVKGSAADATFLPGVNRVVFVGDSITHSGQYIEDIEAYVRSRQPERSIEFLNLGLPSETVSGLSEPGHAGGSFPRPDLHERLERLLRQTKPDLIVACYGMNDGIYHPLSEDRFTRFKDGIERLRRQAAAAGAKVLHVTPPTFDARPLKGKTLPAGLAEYRQPYEGYNEVLDRYSEWLLSRRADGWDVVDIHGPMNQHLQERRAIDPNYRLAGDGVHINATGHWLIARELLVHWGAPAGTKDFTDPNQMLSVHPRSGPLFSLIQQRHRLLRDAWLSAVGHLRPGMSQGLPMAEATRQASELNDRIRSLAQPFPGRRSSWNGFDRFDFEVDGKPVLVVTPRQSAPGRPWVWHGEFFGHKPAPDIALLGQGFHVVYLNVPDMLGGPEAVEHWNALYQELTTTYGFGKKAGLVGLSRGGLYCYNWAIANPDKVACLYGDAPVCDFKSWPGGRGKGKGSPRDWQLVLQQYQFKSESEALAYPGNPVDKLAPLAARRVPLLHVYGDADDVVPWEENTGLVAERYRALGGPIVLIPKPGGGHHPHGLEDSTPIVEFLRTNSLAANAKPAEGRAPAR